MGDIEDHRLYLFKKSFWFMLGTIYMNLMSLLFWIVSSRFSTTEDVGYATTAFSIIMLLSGTLTLGTGMAILKYGSVDSKKSQIFSATIFINLILSVITVIILMIWGGRGLYGEEYRMYITMAAFFYPFMIFGNILLMALLGAMKSEVVTIIRFITSSVKFGLAVLFAIIYSKITGLTIFISASAPVVLGFILSLPISMKTFKFTPKVEKAWIVETLKIGLANMPSRIFNIILINFGTVLLAFFTADPSLVGVVYISLMIMLALAGISGSFSTMALPHSTATDYHSYVDSLRYGIAFTIVGASVIASAPRFILSIINPEMAFAWKNLVVLMWALIIYVVIMNVITEWNAKSEYLKVSMIGIIMLVMLPAILYISTMIPQIYDISIGLALLISLASAFCYILLSSPNKWFVKWFIEGAIIMGLSSLLGILLTTKIHPFGGIIASFTLSSILIVFVFKIISFNELLSLLKGLLQK